MTSLRNSYLRYLLAIVVCIPCLAPAFAQSVTATVTVGGAGYYVQTNPVTNMAYVANSSGNTVSVIDGATNTVKATVPVGSMPTNIALNSATNTVYVANRGNGTVSVINGATNTVSTTVSVGTSPSGIAVNSATNTVYVANANSNTVSVINGATNMVTMTVSVGTSPHGLALNSVTNTVYVGNQGSGTVSVINGATSAVTATLNVGINPWAVGVNPATNMVYVANYANGAPSTMSVINGATNTVTATVSVGVYPENVLVNPVTNTVYLVNEGSDTVSVINGATNTVTATVSTGRGPASAALNLATNTLYVANIYAGTMTVINGATNTATATVGLASSGNWGLALNPVTNTVYVTCTNNNSISVINGATNTVAATITVGTNPAWMALNPATSAVYVANANSNSVSVINGATNAVATTIPVGLSPYGVALNPATNIVYVTNSGSNTVSVIDGTTNQVMATIPVGATPMAVAVNPVTNMVYVSNNGSNTMTVIDGGTNVVTATISVGAAPRGVDINPMTNTVYVANSTANTVSVINGATNGVTATVGVGSQPVAVAVNPITNMAYVANQLGNSVSVINGATNAVTATVNVGTMLDDLAVNSTTNLVYASEISANSVAVISGVMNTVKATASAGSSPNGIVVNPSTGVIYASNSGSTTVTMIQPNAGASVPWSLATAGMGDAFTLSGYAVWSTSNPNPSFTTTAQSSFSPTSLPPTVLYYQLDRTYGTWNQATQTNASGTNPGDYSFSLTNVSPGVHILYTYAEAADFDHSFFGEFSPSFNLSQVSAYVFFEALAPTTTALASSENPAPYGTAVTFIATVTPIGDTAVPTGTVSFYNGATLLGTQTLNSSGQATYATSNLTPGTYSISAVYSGDTSNHPSTSSVLSQVINPQTPVVTVGNVLISYGTASATLTALVSYTGSGVAPSGAVTLSVNGGATVVATCTGSSSPLTCTASYPTGSLAAGTYAITATEAASANYNTAAGSGMLAVNSESTATTVISSVNPSQYMQSVTFTATVAPIGSTATPAGTVQFSIDGTNVGIPVTLSNGTASFTTATLAVGLHTITAVYSPASSNFIGSSRSTGQRVGAVATSTTTLNVSPTTVMYGNTTTLTAVVAPAFATGTVSFYEGSTLLGTASLDNTAMAVLPISTLNAGVHNITAMYNGDPGVPASTSNTAQLTVTKRTASGGGPAITVVVNDASRTTTQSNPPFTYSAAGQLVNGDSYSTAISGTPNYSTAVGSSVGTYSIAVSGLTSANYEIAFVPGDLTVAISPSATTLVVSPSSTQYGDPVTLNATVTSGATGTVSFYDGSILLGIGPITSGVATLTTTTLVAGTHTVTAVYNGDAIYASSQSGSATVTVMKRQSSGGGAALTVTIQNASREYNTSDPQFAYVVTGALVNGDSYATAVTGTPVYASTDTATSPAGSTFPVSVNGLNSANYETIVVNGTLTIAAAPTTTTLTASTVSAQYGDPVTLTATVTPNDATGTVLFMSGSIVIGNAAVTNGVATLTIASLPGGTYTLAAFYQGDANYSASTSRPVALTINQKTGLGGTAALTITVTDVGRGYGQGNPSFTYTVTGALVNGDTYATAITGVPVFSTNAVPLSPAGSYPISLAGLNSQNYLITFVNGTLVVTKNTPGQNGTANITLSSSPNPSTLGQTVTFTATVPTGATGTVQFMEGSTELGTGTISGTTATYTTTTLTAGTHPVTAVYSGDANYSAASSTVDNQVVSNNLDFTLTLTSAGKQTVMPGGAAPYKVQVAPTNVVYPGTVIFSATGLPPGAMINFLPATVASNAGPTPSAVSVQTASQKTALNKGNAGSLILAALLLPFATARRFRNSSRRPLFALIVLLGGLVAILGLTGCGYNGNGFFGQAPKTYDITITATSGTIQHSINVTLEVQ